MNRQTTHIRWTFKLIYSNPPISNIQRLTRCLQLDKLWLQTTGETCKKNIKFKKDSINTAGHLNI